MPKSAKELAYLRDLYVDSEWTRRFTELSDKHFGYADDKSLLYINAGTGNHALEIGSKAGPDARICAVCEDLHLLAIAREKAIATNSQVDFSDLDELETESFDSVIADASFVSPADLASLLDDSARFVEIGGTVAAFVVASGSFGEIFSLLWEVMLEEHADEINSLAERLITALPTVSSIEDSLGWAGLEDIETYVSNEVFEFENGSAFAESPLIADFLMPGWFADLSTEEIGRIRERLVQLIDAEDGSLTFRFSVKAVLVTGRKS
ncbi:MAG TPA: hypothetical protein PKM58_01555 [Pyrinomonadaceae bacterium]|nr:hypothetical protein [Pyrinomonadaceae bacterium]